MNILEVCVDLDGGGIDRYLYNYCTRITDVHFDFAIIKKDKTGILEKPLEQCGFHVYKIPRQRDSVIENYKALKKIMLDNRYDVVHVHLGYMSVITLLCAKRCGIKARIAHAHIAAVPESNLKRIIRKILTFASKKLATNLAACGTDAARWVWGEKTYNKGLVTIHNNAIQTEIYAFSLEKRNLVRKDLGFKDELVVGHVGRLCEQKNQLRLIDIFYALLKIENNAQLILIGQGELETQIISKIRNLGIQKQVHLLGVRNDVPMLLNAMDVFVFPSLYEGLPFTLIETQCNGLPCVSADSVTSQVLINSNTVFISLDELDKKWADLVLKMAEQGHDRQGYINVQKAGYDIDIEAQKLKNYYASCTRGL